MRRFLQFFNLGPRGYGWLTLFSVVWALTGRAAPSDEWVVSLKAGFVLNFAKFTTWPEHLLPRGADLRIGVLGADNDIELIAEKLNGKLVRGHSVAVVAIEEREVAGYHVIYVTSSATPLQRAQLVAVPTVGVLWIGDAPDFAFHAPGVIAFFERDGKIRFRLNLEQAKHQGLQMSSKLASLAERVGS